MRFRRRNIPRSNHPTQFDCSSSTLSEVFFFEDFLNTRHEYMIFPFAQHSEPHRWISMSMATFLFGEGEAAKHHHIKPVSLPARASWHDVKKENLILTMQPRKTRAPPFPPPRLVISYLSALFAFASGGDHHTPTEEDLGLPTLPTLQEQW